MKIASGRKMRLGIDQINLNLNLMLGDRLKKLLNGSVEMNNKAHTSPNVFLTIRFYHLLHL